MTPAVRADALRSRERILAAARGREVGDLRLNEVARAAGVGVGTVYRHFPTVQALVEALSIETLRHLRDLAESASREPDPYVALRRSLEGALELQLQDGGLQTLIVAPETLGEESRALRAEVDAAHAQILTRAQREGAVRSDVTTEQLQRLVCGLEHAVRLGAPGDGPLLLDVALGGLRVDVPATRRAPGAVQATE
ncbi:TetR/AcrR family transcriptional regulator [Acrocarpospora catenulata]|uniref:TetR/AcrR family transcriptional regulator n=1 Tax=Acrocarpospora catenulata TaxID=2836182 RepID=UPI001BDB5412|nr:TetR family transcriptional regulator [Acrocarpospora catenulata]